MGRSKRKADSQFIHAQRRALERFDIHVSRADVQSMVKSIQSGVARPIFRQSQRLTVFSIKHVGIEMFLVYDKQRKSIVTFLTEDMVHDNWWLEIGASDEVHE